MQGHEGMNIKPMQGHEGMNIKPMQGHAGMNIKLFKSSEILMTLSWVCILHQI